MKKIFVICNIVGVLFLFGLMFGGCDFSIMIKKPQIYSFGNVVYWDEIDDADSYVLTIDEEQKEVFTNYYIFENSTVSSQITVRAKVGEKLSRKSDAVSVIRTAGFTEDETYDINLQSGRSYDVLPSQNYVKLSGSANNSQITIQNRSRDLVVELDGVSLTSSQGKDCIATAESKYDAEQLNFSVVFIVKGENKISGANYTTTPSKQPENSGRLGTRGGNGGNAVVLPNIVMVGDGTIDIKGGNGGNGGDGADSSGISTSSNGSGGNGGNGGNGILCTNFVMAMNVDGIVKSYGGNGGNGGKVGVNGSIMTGPWVSIAQSRKDGSNGNKGSNIIGNTVRLSGSLN